MDLRARYSGSMKTVITAHRGFSGQYPENTLLAFSKACELGVDIVEFDVREAADGGLVIIHDGDLDRTTNGTGPVNQHDLSDLKRLDAAYHCPHEGHGRQTAAERGALLMGFCVRDVSTAAIDDDIKGEFPAFQPRRGLRF